MPVRIYGELYAHKFCAVDIFWNITYRQAISPVAKFHHVLGRGISYSVNSNAHTTPVRIYGEPYAHRFYAVDISLEYHRSSSNITRCQVPSRVRAWFHDSAGDISESTILHESIILIFIKYLSDNQNRLF